LLALLLAVSAAPQAQEFPKINLPDGFAIERVASGLHLPTAITWDDQGTLYIAEAGGGLFPEQLAPIRIVRIENGESNVVVDLSDQIEPALVSMVWHGGAFYITHRVGDLTGAVSRVTMDGQVTRLFDGIVDAQSEHQINDIRVGPDGRLYVSVGLAANAAVVGPDIAPFVMQSPELRPRPCQDIVLTGRNHLTPDFRTPSNADSVLTGAFVPFGTETQPGQVIPGVTKCGGSILAFDPANAEATLEVYAWGFRNLIGLAWAQDGTMYAAENGYDVRGARPVADEIDATLRVEQGVWYGVPDFSAGRQPLTDPMFAPPDSLLAPVFIGGQFVGRELGFLIDHAASGLTPPTPDLVAARHPVHSSPSMLDVAPASWGDLAGHVFVAEWGDLTPPTNPTEGPGPVAGYRVVRFDPANGEVVPFFRNQMPGPASAQPPAGEPGAERPFDVKFGPDGALYVVDYGVVTIDFSQAPPYAYQEDSGTLWKIIRMASSTDGGAAPADALRLDSAHPNPFASAATIAFHVPSAAPVRLLVYDVMGREVARLVDGELPAGPHEARLDASGLASGTYFVRLESGGVSQTQRVTLVR